MLRYKIRNLKEQFCEQVYISYLSTQSMLIDVIFVAGNWSKSSSYRIIYLYQLKGQNNEIVKSKYTYLSHDHDLVAWQVKLLDSLSKNNFGMSIRIHLIIGPQGKDIKSGNKNKKQI